MVYSVKILCNIQFQIIETLRFPVSLFQPIMQAVDCFVCSPAYSASVAVRNELLFKIWVQLAIYSVLRHPVFESEFQPCGLLTIFTAIQSFSYGSRLAAFGMEINPFNPDALDVSTCGHDCWQKWGEAERKDTLLLTLERALFKFSAPAPPLEVLLKLEPRIGTASPLLTAYSHNIKSRCYPAFYQSYFAALPFPEVLPFSDL